MLNYRPEQIDWMKKTFIKNNMTPGEVTKIAFETLHLFPREEGNETGKRAHDRIMETMASSFGDFLEKKKTSTAH